MKICLFFFHEWEIIQTSKVRDVSFGEPGIRYTRILKKCNKCNKYKSSLLDGWWNI